MFLPFKSLRTRINVDELGSQQEAHADCDVQSKTIYVDVEDCENMIDLRQRALANKRGHPFSAMIVERSTGRSIVAVNRVITAKDPTAHAEIEAIRKAGKRGFSFEDCVIICSGEPCPMCATAIAWAGMNEVYYLDSYKVANDKGFCFDQDVQRVNRLLNLGLRIGRRARFRFSSARSALFLGEV